MFGIKTNDNQPASSATKGFKAVAVEASTQEKPSEVSGTETAARMGYLPG